ncbi:MAG TPA: 50S ribosomal protein L24e [Candidatus Thermoplasmatota archaeon]|nr:50S ribosomal protein L24e [Candidatus Thermoplasmatota archaeon]
MPERKECAFCGTVIEPGTGRLFVRRDGTRHNFCTEKCQKNLLKLRRIPRNIKWTRAYVKGTPQKPAATAGATEAPPTPKAKSAAKPRAAVAPKK